MKLKKDLDPTNIQQMSQKPNKNPTDEQKTQQKSNKWDKNPTKIKQFFRKTQQKSNKKTQHWRSLLGVGVFKKPNKKHNILLDFSWVFFVGLPTPAV
jgi:hypothetical protein